MNKIKLISKIIMYIYFFLNSLKYILKSINAKVVRIYISNNQSYYNL